MTCYLSAGKSLLTPTRIYVSSTLAALRSGLVKAAAHITGGGLPGNVVRVLPDSVAVHLDANSWTVPPVFGWISQMVFVCYSAVACAVTLFHLIDSATFPMPVDSAGVFFATWIIFSATLLKCHFYRAAWNADAFLR